MKKIYLVRHAKSSWSQIDLNDFDRPLNDRGKEDAPVMAKRLRKLKTDVDALVSSPALRAKSTAVIFSESLKIKKKKIIFEEELYHAGVQNFFSVIERISNDLDEIAIFSHNPGITDFANALLTGVQVDNMPTCSIFGVEAQIKQWKDFRTSQKRFLFFEYPKKGL